MLLFTSVDTYPTDLARSHPPLAQRDTQRSLAFPRSQRNATESDDRDRQSSQALHQHCKSLWVRRDDRGLLLRREPSVVVRWKREKARRIFVEHFHFSSYSLLLFWFSSSHSLLLFSFNFFFSSATTSLSLLFNFFFSSSLHYSFCFCFLPILSGNRTVSFQKVCDLSMRVFQRVLQRSLSRLIDRVHIRTQLH